MSRELGFPPSDFTAKLGFLPSKFYRKDAETQRTAKENLCGTQRLSASAVKEFSERLIERMSRELGFPPSKFYRRDAETQRAAKALR
ncbi:MAG TPA: hypothetical protein VFW11_14170 [Cyclobacteriaceae bacterium]|nr:hypothetical protein [Cyclobacteriaceae bacterium]